MKLYHFIRKTYPRKGDALTLAAIVRGQYPYRVERCGRRWVFTVIIDEAGYDSIALCL